MGVLDAVVVGITIISLYMLAFVYVI